MTNIRITTAQRTYLAAFDVWLKEVWAKGLTGPAAAELEDRKSDALGAVMVESDSPAASKAA